MTLLHHCNTQISKEELFGVDHVRGVLDKTVGSASTAWTSQNLGGLEGKNVVALKGGVQSIRPHLKVEMFLQMQQS